MMHYYWTISTCLCFMWAITVDQSSGIIRGGSYNWTPSVGFPDEELKTYIVVYKNTDSASLAMARNATYSVVDSVGGNVLFEYDTALNGAAVTLTVSAAEQLKLNDAIAFIEEDKPVYPANTSN